MIKYQALIDALEAGPTGGGWITDPANPNLVAVDSDPYEYICQVAPAEFSESDHSDKQERINAAYIAAANPATIRALLADRKLGMEIIEGVLKADRDADGRIVLHGRQVAAIDAALAQMAGGG